MEYGQQCARIESVVIEASVSTADREIGRTHNVRRFLQRFGRTAEYLVGQLMALRHFTAGQTVVGNGVGGRVGRTVLLTATYAAVFAFAPFADQIHATGTGAHRFVGVLAVVHRMLDFDGFVRAEGGLFFAWF